MYEHIYVYKVDMYSIISSISADCNAKLEIYNWITLS